MSGRGIKYCLIVAVVSFIVSSAKGSYLGCYKEARKRVYTFNPGVITASTLTPSTCQLACTESGYSYAALSGKFCFCSNERPDIQLTQTSADKCNVPCEGDSSQTCGSLTHVLVFALSRPVSVSIDANPKITYAGNTVVLTTDVKPPGSGFEMRLDYGDFTGLTEYAHNGIGLLSRTFYQAGEYIITSYSTDTSWIQPDQTWARSVRVHAPVTDVVLTCPPSMVTFEPSSCTVEVLRGTGMQITINYTDGDKGPEVSETFSIADSSEHYFGSIVTEHVNIRVYALSAADVTGYMFIQPWHRAEYAGTIVGFEYYAQTHGSFTVYVYRPDCTGTYCYETNTCTSGSCGLTCSAGDYCADIHDCCSSPNTASSNILPKYTLIASILVNVSAPGYQFHYVTETIDVISGDILAHAQSSSSRGVLASVNQSATSDYKCLGDGAATITTASSCQFLGMSHQLKAVYSQKSKIFLPLTFSKPGNVTMHGTVENADQVNVAGKITKSTIITVYEGVNASVINVPYCIEVGQAVILSVEPYTGSPAVVAWDFGDQSVVTNANDPGAISHTYTSSGPYNVSATIKNSVSERSNMTTVCVEERITGLEVRIPTSVLVVGDVYSIQVVIATGSHYSCLIDFMFSDGTKHTFTFVEGDSLTFSYKFLVAGDVSTSTNCSNKIASTTANYNWLAVERITGVALTPMGAAVGKDFQIVLAWATGSNVTVDRFTYDGVAIPMTVSDTLRYAISDDMNENAIGRHLINYQVSNPLGTVSIAGATFTIESPIKNAVITCTFINQTSSATSSSYAIIPVNTNVECTVSMSQGTSVVISIDFGDGSPANVQSASVGQGWASAAASFTLPIVHTFTIAQYCPMSVTVGNAFRSVKQSFPVWVMVGVDNAFMNPVLSVFFDPPAALDFTFSVTSGPVPNAVTCYIEWGDGNYDQYSPCDLTETYRHVYMDEDGDLRLTYTLTNLASQKTGTLDIYIVTPIVNVECYTQPSAGALNEPFEIIFKADRAPPPGVLDLGFDCTSDGLIDVSRKRINASPDGLDSELCTVGSAGTYTMTITARSRLETHTCFHTYKVLGPVTEDFHVLTFNNAAPVDYEFTQSCSVVYQIEYYGLPLPDQAWIEFDHGDGVTSDPIAFATLLNKNYVYASPGHYFTTVTIYNDASNVTRTIASGCYAKFLGNSIVVLREPLIPMNGPDVPGYGVFQDIFRTDEKLKIYPTLDAGTLVYWEVAAQSTSEIYTCNDTNKDVISLTIQKPGTYTVNVTPNNPLYSGPTASTVVKMYNPVDNITVSGYGTTKAHVNKKFNVTMVNYGTSMCVAVYYGDISNGYVVERYGNNVTCSNAPAIRSVFNEFSSLTIIDGQPTDVSKSFSLFHKYTELGTFTLKLFAWNIISSDYAEHQFAVSELNCDAPILDIRNRARNFRYPIIYKRSKRIKITGLTDIACPETLRNTKLWTAILWNQTINAPIKELDLSDVPSRVNSELAFEPQYLKYGVYKLIYKVTMLTVSSTGERFSSSVDTFIQVVPSDLVVKLLVNSMSFKSIGANQLLTLSPKDLSYDPDVGTVYGEIDIFDSFEMACRDITLGEMFPNNTVRVFAANLTDIPSGHIDTGGCFQTGPGWIRRFSGSVTFWTNILKVGHTYEFLVIGYKDTRSASFIGRVEVVSPDPPDFSIGFELQDICLPSPDGKIFNPDAQLGLFTNMAKLCSTCTYQWELLAFDYQYCGPVYECWRNLAYFGRYIDRTQSKELTILPEVFSHYKTVDNFQVRLAVTDTATTATGSVYLNLTRNHPPEGGSCNISPSNGTSLSTTFSIHCADFYDEDGIDNYMIKCRGGGRWMDVASGSQTDWDMVYLPVGDATNSNKVKCRVVVMDSLGAKRRFPMTPVTVHPLSMENFRDMLESMVQEENDMSDIIDAVANLDLAAGYILAMTSMLREMDELDEQTDYEGLGTVLSFARTGLDSTASRPSVFTQDQYDPEKLERYETVRDAGAKIVQQLTHTLQAVTVESTTETIRQADAISKMSSSFPHLTRETLDTMTELLENGVNNMNNNINTMTIEEIEEIGQATMDACSNIEQAAILTADYPTNTDVDTQAENVIQFDSNLDSTLDDVDTFTSDNDALRDGKMIYNKVAQNDFASTNLKKCEKIQEDVVYILTSHKPESPNPTILKSPSFEAAIIKNSAYSLVNQSLSTGGSSVNLPADMFSTSDDNTTFVMMIKSKASTGAPLEENGPVSKYSRELSINFKYPKGTSHKISKLHTPVTLKISQDPFKPKLNLSALKYANPLIVSTSDDYLFYHELEVHNQNAAIMIIFRPTNISVDNQLLVLVNHDEMPAIDNLPSKVKHVCMIPSDTRLTDFYGSETEPDAYSCFVDSAIVGNLTGMWRIGVRQLLPKELDKYNKKGKLPREVPDEWKRNKEFSQDYIISATEITCAYMEEGSSVRKTDGVKPSPLSTEDAVQCETTHLTNFAGGWAVAPNTIDWNFVFSNADFFKNPTLYITEIVIAIAYVFAMLWARRKDKQDVQKLGLAPLPDNDPHDKYYYEILVSTGMRRGAGTESVVHFILSGEEVETEVRTFEDKKRKIFTRGTTDGFLMSVPEPIGALTYLRLWHDNSGKGRAASWYLNHVIVRDVQTDKKYYFIVNRWFAVEEDDGQVDRVIPIAGKEQMTEFTQQFMNRTTKNLSDGHLWFSVVTRPPQSRFTRCQRVSCCLCLLFTSMLANAMFYGTETSDSAAFQFGPFALTSTQIFIGVAANLIIFPINFILILLFRKSRPRKLRPSRVEEAIKSIPERSTSMTDVNPRVTSSLSTEIPGPSGMPNLLDEKRRGSSLSRSDSSASRSETLDPTIQMVNVESKKKKKCELPWYFTIVAWILLWVATLVSAAFVTFYGIMFQDIKCKKWITSMLISVVTSVFLTQPIKVILAAILFSLIVKNPGSDDDEHDDDEEAPKKLEVDEEYLHDNEDEFGFASPRKPKYIPKPPDTNSLEKARQQRLKEIQMWSVIREILFYVFFLWILLVISYRSVSTYSYQYKLNMEKVFILTNNTDLAFSAITNTEDFWNWARSGMLRGIRAGPYYNNFPPFYMRGYIDDKQSRLMGYAVLRQLRVKPKTCKIPRVVEGIVHECNDGYSISEEEDRDFGTSWTSRGTSSSREEYQYQKASSLNGYPYWGIRSVYGGGGYVVRLNQDYFTMISYMDQLRDEGWIDKYTRAVFLEFTVYNPSINMFVVSTLLAEFSPSGGVIPSYRFQPCNLLPYMNPALLFQIVCEIIYVAFTVFFIVKEIRYIVKLKTDYFFQFWNLIDLSIAAMSVTAIVIYFYRIYCINYLTDYFKETNGNEYMKFQYVAYWTEIFSYIIGFLVFFATLKFLKLLRFNKKISLLSDTLRHSSKDLIHFSIIFNVVFLAFIQLFYLMYMAHVDIFNTFVSSFESGIVMMMGKFDIYKMVGVNQWMTQIFIFLFVVSVTFIVVNMLLSILNDTFSSVRNDPAKQQNEYEIVDFMLKRLRLLTGIGQARTTSSAAEHERNNKNRTLEMQIEYFPDKIDRFLASVSQMYIGDAKFDDVLHKRMAEKLAMKAQAQQAAMAHKRAQQMRVVQRLNYGARGMTDVQTD